MCERCGNPKCKGVRLSIFIPENDEEGLSFCIHDPNDTETVLIQVPLKEPLLDENMPVEEKMRAVYYLEQLVQKLNEQIDNPKGLQP